MDFLAAIFDVDGTLLDSMGIWKDAASKYLEQLGIRARTDLAQSLFTATLQTAAIMIKNEYSLLQTEKEIEQGILAIVQDFYFYEAKLKDGAREFLEMLDLRDIKMVVVSSGVENLIEAAFSRLGILKFFKKILTGKKVEDEIFNQAQKILGIPKNQTIVFEDALYAIKKAKSLGFLTAAIFDEQSKDATPLLRTEANIFFENWRNLPKILFD